MSAPAERVTGTVPIATVSKELDVPVPTIRSWERRYGFPRPARTGGRHRRYTTREIDQLRDLRDLITRGLPPREAVRRLEAHGSDGRAADLTTAVVEAAVRLDSQAIRAALDEATQRLGVEGAIAEVALPAMREIGTRWKVGTCDVEQEHLATETVRTWLGRHAAIARPASRAETIVLACGPKDLHTIGLEAFGVILARRGWQCRVLGAITPVGALVSAVGALRAVAAVVTSQQGVTRRSAVEAVAGVDAIPGVHAFYAGDAFVAPSSRRGVPGRYLGDDVLAAAALLEETLGARGRRRVAAGTSGSG